MKKLLIIPSWYPHPDNKIGGSFFQEQAKLVSDIFDVKVLHLRFVGRPSIRALTKKPVSVTLEWVRYFLLRKSRVNFGNDKVFLNPPLVEYRLRLWGWTPVNSYRKSLDAYLEATDELVASGWKPDLVHAHSVNLGGLVADRIKEVHQVPYLITEHMPFALCNYPNYLREDIKRAFREASLVLSLGYDMVRQLGISGIEVEPNYIYNLVDDSVFAKLCSAYEPHQTLNIISVGAASHYKDHKTLLLALLELKERGVGFSMTLVGLKAWGDLYDETLQLIQDNGLASHIKVIDRVERDEVCELLIAHNVFVMTSIFETFCVSIIEALACGLPVITTNHGGGSIDLMTEKTGFVVPVRDYRALADKLEDIYTGKACFDHHTIREYIVSVCGRTAFKDRLCSYYNSIAN